MEFAAAIVALRRELDDYCVALYRARFRIIKETIEVAASSREHGSGNGVGKSAPMPLAEL